METVLIHIAKSTVLALLFLTSYILFLRKETFYTSNRFYLITGIVLSAILPFLKFTKTVWVEREPIMYGDFTIIEPTPVSGSEPFNWSILFILIYIAGLIFFTIRLALQLRSISRLKQKSEIVHENDIKHVRSKKQLSPFSFFKNIFYCPYQYTNEELKAIITHEKAHAKQYHSADVLFMQVICLLLWFNPLVWIYKHYVKQNLEFLADNAALKQVSDKKKYQYLMLKQAIGRQHISIANPFFNTLIKKRIVMLNQKQSKSINSLKLLFILPFLILFLVSFNTKEIIKFPDSPIDNSVSIDLPPDFISPLRSGDIKKVSSSFGPARNPFTKQMDFHNGIDLVAAQGKPVRASAHGVIKTSSMNDDNGNFIVVAHEDGYLTKYMHLQNRSVDEGDEVSAGTTIGYVGSTGKSTGPHLHFEIIEFGKPINPASMIPFKSPTVMKTGSKVIPKEKMVLNYKNIELLINKNTSNEELEKIKSDLAEDDIDFSYTTVRNDDREIIDISIEVAGTGKNGATFKNAHSSSDNKNGIAPLVILIDRENNLVSIGTKGSYKKKISKIGKGESHIWVSSDDNEHKEVIVKKEGGKNKIYIDGEEVPESELQEHNVNVFIDNDEDGSDNNFSFHISTDDDEAHEKHVKIKRKRGKKGKSTMIIHDSHDDSDIDVLNGEGFFFVDTDGTEPLYIIDGKEVSKKQVKKLNPDDIATIDIRKGDGATKKYGKKAENGVVEIITKKKN